MNIRDLRIRFALGGLFAALVLVGLWAVGATAATAATAASATTVLAPISKTQSENADPTILARRLISIPFGINSPLELAPGGQSVVVTGHGDCTGGSSYRVQVRVSQSGHPTVVGTGRTESGCPAGQFQWEAEATVHGNKSFNEGPASVCALAIVRDDAGNTVTYHWCKDVALTEQR